MIRLTGKVFKINTTNKGAYIKLMLKPNKVFGEEKKWESPFISIYFSSKSLEFSKIEEGDIIEVEALLKNGNKDNNYKDSYISMSCYNWSNRSKANAIKKQDANGWVNDFLDSNNNATDEDKKNEESANLKGMDWLNEL